MLLEAEVFRELFRFPWKWQKITELWAFQEVEAATLVVEPEPGQENVHQPVHLNMLNRAKRSSTNRSKNHLKILFLFIQLWLFKDLNQNSTNVWPIRADWASRGGLLKRQELKQSVSDRNGQRAQQECKTEEE